MYRSTEGDEDIAEIDAKPSPSKIKAKLQQKLLRQMTVSNPGYQSTCKTEQINLVQLK